jgi:hypothetical protein
VTGATGPTGPLTTVAAGDNKLAADVTLVAANTLYNGPAVTLQAGTYLLVGKVVCRDSAAQAKFTAELWNGTTVLDSAEHDAHADNVAVTLPLCAIATPVGETTYTIRVASTKATNGRILAACPTNGVGDNASHLVALTVA